MSDHLAVRYLLQDGGKKFGLLDGGYLLAASPLSPGRRLRSGEIVLLKADQTTSR